MNFLEEKILTDGVIKQGNILKVDNFLNHQIEIDIMRQMAYEFKRRFKGVEVNKVLTIEASGIAIATLLGDLYDVPVVFAKKSETANSTDDKYMSQAYSFTHKQMNNVFISRPYLNEGEKVLIVDDFLADGNAAGDNMAADTQAMLEECFAFAAFATVGDVMDLVDENHIIVKFGLDKIKNCRNLGLSALISACELEGKKISPYHIGFVLGPCFNASGRLDDAYRVIDLLNAKSKDEAERLAAELKALNQERQDLTGIGEEAAYAQVEDMDLMKNRVLVVYLPGVHESLAGIIAGRLCNKYYRPTFVLTDGEGCVKGSGRSIEAYHMYDEMTKIKDIFLKYGGHKLAAGLSIASDRVDEFRSRINEVCTLTEADLEEKLILDMHLHIGWVTDAFMDQLMLLEPYGNGNERPVFAERVYISRLRVLGANRNVVRMQIRNEDNSVATGIYFGDGDAVMREYQESAEKKARIAYSPEWNEYQGVRSLQMRIRYLEWY